MGVKISTTDLINLAFEKSLRFDVDFLEFRNRFLHHENYSFFDLFEFVNNNKVEVDKLKGDFLYSEIGDVSNEGDVEPVTLNFNNQRIEDKNYYSKIEKGDILQAEENDILISKVRPNLKKIILINSENKNIYYTSAFIHLRPKKINKLLYYALRSVFFENIIAISRQGKGYPTIKEDDCVYLQFNKRVIDNFSLMQEEIYPKIEKIESQISQVKSKIRSPQEIINEAFDGEFGFDRVLLEKNKTENKYYVSLSDFGNNIDLRQSVKFHRPSGNFVITELEELTQKKIKNFISEPIVLGKSISPEDYDENGEYYYISMANIKNWKWESKDAKHVSEKFAKNNANKVVRKNDILLARSGEGTIGKVALIDENDLLGIFADFTMRIRLSNYDPMFGYYFFRTDYFQYLVEINKKGLGNNTNIFPNQLQEFPLIDIPIKEQKRIVNDIKKKLDEREKLLKNIEEEKSKIEEIIIKASKGY